MQKSKMGIDTIDQNTHFPICKQLQKNGINRNKAG